MQSGVAKQGLSAFIAIQLLCLLMLAGCNLNIMPGDPSPSFEGPPAIHIAAPRPGQKFESGATVIVQARVENAGPDIARVAVLLDDYVMGERLNPNEIGAEVLPLTIDWPTSNEGDYIIAVIAERGDGGSAREEVSIMVVPPGQFEAPEAAPDQAAATAVTANAPGDAAQATATDPSEISGRVIRPAPLRPGPGADSGQPVGSLMADDGILIIAVNPAGNWYRIRRGAEIDGWVDASLVSAAGDISGLPIETGAPQAPSEGVNLVVTSLNLEPDPPVCGQTTIVRATVRNSGAVDSQTSPWVTAQAHLLSDDSVQAQNPNTVYLPSLAAGKETTLEIPLTLTGRYAQLHVIRVTIDQGNHVIETHENDNIGASRQFELRQGACSA